MAEIFHSKATLEDIEEHIKYEYEVESVALICESVPLSDRKVRMFLTDNSRIIMRYDAEDIEGDSSYSEGEVDIIGRGSYNNGLSRLMATYCKATLIPGEGVARLEE